ncbi:MAG: serine acetyltransferase [Meiothermus sp.]
MDFKEYVYLLRSDLYRYSGKVDAKAALYNWLRQPGFKFSFWLRTCNFLQRRKPTRYTIYPIARLFLDHYTFKFGIYIPYETQVASGLHIGHFGGIVVNENAIIGKNCNLSHGVTLGQTNRGKRQGSPVIGDNVYIGPGAKVIGHVRVGNNVAIGANCVVTSDIPDNAVVVGIPGRVISYDGAEGYVNNTDYEALSGVS